MIQRNLSAAAPLRQAILMRVSLLIAATVLPMATGFAVFGLLPMIERIAQSPFNAADDRSPLMMQQQNSIPRKDPI